MHAIKAVYNGSGFFPIQPVPVKGNYDVVITFLGPSKEKYTRPPFEYGDMEGKIWMADDFDAPLDDFLEYM